MSQDLFLGIDIGTSGMRACCIDDDGQLVDEIRRTHHCASNRQAAATTRQWQDDGFRLISSLCARHGRKRIRAISIDGTSGTVLFSDRQGQAVSDILMYDSIIEPPDDVDPSVRPQLDRNPALVRALSLLPDHGDSVLCHQADWLASCLTARYGVTDYNNALKSGYDAEQLRWPDWIEETALNLNRLPEVIAPGETIGTVDPDVASRLGLADDCRVVAGTTDSIAAFIAAGAEQTGDAVTSLGNTLVVKQLTSTPIESVAHGVYSHRYYADESLWLVGGASNTGCRVLSELFDPAQIEHMTEQLSPNTPTGHRYYPLPPGTRGERFPLNDPDMAPVLVPRPADDLVYFQGLLESIAAVEEQAYQRLQQLGCEPIRKVITTGGGSINEAWRRMRAMTLGVEVTCAAQSEAAYGSALLARGACQR